jgi:hypothetical protein
MGWSKAPAEQSARGKSKESLRVAILTRRSEDELANCDIYEAILKAGERQVRIVSVPNPRSFRRTAEANVIQLSRVPWNTFDVGLLVEAEHTLRKRDPLSSLPMLWPAPWLRGICWNWGTPVSPSPTRSTTRGPYWIREG